MPNLRLLLPSVCGKLHTSQSSCKMQECKVSTGKWMLSVESLVNMQRKLMCLHRALHHLWTCHTALAHTTTSIQYRIKYVLYAPSLQATTWLFFRLHLLTATNIHQLDTNWVVLWGATTERNPKSSLQQ